MAIGRDDWRERLNAHCSSSRKGARSATVRVSKQLLSSSQQPSRNIFLGASRCCHAVIIPLYVSFLAAEYCFLKKIKIVFIYFAMWEGEGFHGPFAAHSLRSVAFFQALELTRHLPLLLSFSLGVVGVL